MNMDSRLSAGPVDRGRWRTVAGLAMVAALVLGIPAASFAVTAKTIGFNISKDDFVVGVRIPASAGNDFTMPARTDGIFASDAYGCPSADAAYNSALIQSLPGSPDRYVVLRSGRDFCALQLTVPGLDWDSGKYHFQVSPYYAVQPAGSGFVRASW